MIQNKCHNCESCEIINVTRTDRNGREVKYSYCKKQQNIHDLCNWTYRSNAGYIGSATKIPLTGKYEYFTSFFKDDPENEIDHINGDNHQNELRNLNECTRTQNCQNRHDRKGCYFHNVKNNGNNTYTAFKITDGKYTKIATCNTDIEAYDSFVKYARNHQIGINPNTLSWQVYDALKDQIPHITKGGLYG